MTSINTDEDGGLDAIAQLKLTDLIDDCLAHIFTYLDYHDLLSIAHTNKEIKQSADMAFTNKFGKSKFRLHVANQRRVPFIAMISGIHFDIYELKTSLLLLRCFGHLIKKLHIDTLQTNTANRSGDLKYVLSYATKYSLQSLVELSLHNIPAGELESVVTKPFPKVQTLKLSKCHLSAEMSNFNEWFPVLRHFELTNSRLRDYTSIEKRFFHLETLSIVGSGKIPTKSIRTALKLNPKLRSFSSDLAYSPELFRFVNKCLPELNYLKLSGYPEDFSVFHDNDIYFKAVKKVVVGFIGFDGKEHTVSKFELPFDRFEDVAPDLDTCNWTSGLTIPQLCWCKFFSV